MLMSEFLDRVPECTEENYKDANVLYTALPNMDKDTFCMLYRADVALGTGFMEPLRTLVSEYEQWVAKKPYFVVKMPLLHEQKAAAHVQKVLLEKAGLLQQVVEFAVKKFFNGKEGC